MPKIAFDTLKAARNLGQAGFSEAQIDSLIGIFAEALTENLATKDDIELLRRDMTIRLGAIVVAAVAIFQVIDYFFSPLPV